MISQNKRRIPGTYSEKWFLRKREIIKNDEKKLMLLSYSHTLDNQISMQIEKGSSQNNKKIVDLAADYMIKDKE